MAAWRDDLMPTAQLLRDASRRRSFKFRGDHDDGASDSARDRILGAVQGAPPGRPRRAQRAACCPKLLEQDPARRPRRSSTCTATPAAPPTSCRPSPQEIVEPLATALGMTGGIGTVGEVVDGVYTGELDGPFCYGRGKVDAIARARPLGGLDLAQCYAYSDSASDLPMLEAVGHPVAVNPDAKLERHARRHGWPVVIFSQRTKTVIRRTAAGVGLDGPRGRARSSPASRSARRARPPCTGGFSGWAAG